MSKWVISCDDSFDNVDWALGPFDSRDAAVEAGIKIYSNEELPDDRVFYVVMVDPVSASQLIPSAADILEDWNTYAYDNHSVQDWPDLPKEAVQELDDLIGAWAKKHAKDLDPHWFEQVSSWERVEVPC